MTTYRLDIAYEGTGFSGWARQPGLRTVQGELEEALGRLFGRSVELTVAGRTDAGVHALGQVASFEAPDSREPETLLRALNALTARDVAITAAGRAPDGFDARRDAVARCYRYRLDTGRAPSPFERRFAHHFPHRLDRAALDRAAGEIVGHHDFTAFTPTDSYHVRFHREVSEAAWLERPDGILELEIEADAFMRNMVRVLVGTMLEIGSGRRDPESLRALLGGRPREEAGETAPARGLFLLAVRYR